MFHCRYKQIKQLESSGANEESAYIEVVAKVNDVLRFTKEHMEVGKAMESAHNRKRKREEAEEVDPEDTAVAAADGNVAGSINILRWSSGSTAAVDGVVRGSNGNSGSCRVVVVGAVVAAAAVLAGRSNK